MELQPFNKSHPKNRINEVYIMEKKLPFHFAYNWIDLLTYGQIGFPPCNSNSHIYIVNKLLDPL